MFRVLIFASVFILLSFGITLLTGVAPHGKASSKAGIVERKGHLPDQLKEISGWTFVNDTTLIAHNDSGNEPFLYVLNLDGSIRHQALLTGTGNIDFEDITTDNKGNIYLGDFGNNANTRRDLTIWKIKTSDIFDKDEVTGKAIHFSYAEQSAFPPAAAEKYYDAEALAYYKDSLYVLTKCRAEPFDGKCMIYELPTTPGTYKVRRKTYLKLGKGGWLRDSATGAAIYKNELYILTYTKLLIYTLGADRKGTFKTQVSMAPISQKEAVSVRKNGKIYVTDERQKLLGGGTIFVITQKEEKKK